MNLVELNRLGRRRRREGIQIVALVEWLRLWRAGLTGGKALAIPFVKGYSTTALVKKIRQPTV
jgi:hypothetical protein